MRLDPARRKKAEAYALQLLNLVDPTGINAEAAKRAFSRMTDEEFNRLREGLPVYNPTGGKVKIDHMRNIKICEAMGLNLCQRLWLTEPKTGILQRTRYPHLVFRLPARRQTQMQEKKMAVAKNDKVRDKLSGQVVGPSKASGVSFPEAYIMYSDGHDSTLQEFLWARGGNDTLQRAFYQSLRQTGKGRINLEGAERTSSKAPRTWSSYFKAMHIGNNLGRPE